MDCTAPCSPEQATVAITTIISVCSLVFGMFWLIVKHIPWR